VVRLAADAPLPGWALAGEFVSLTRTRDELSVVCEERLVPAPLNREGAWRALKVEGPLDFAMVGVLASIASPLASAGVSIFTISTFDTDYVLVKDDRLATALEALRSAGHVVGP
jgi:hypothetical protein